MGESAAPIRVSEFEQRRRSDGGFEHEINMSFFCHLAM